MKKRSLLETLEQRQLLAAIGLEKGILVVDGDSSDTKITITYSSSSGKVTAAVGSLSESFSKSQINTIQVIGGSKGENISLPSTLAINSWLDGGGGNDTITGGAGIDSILGGAGNDSLNGGAGNDSFLGQDGNDTINGGSGNDRADGGAGTNKYISVEVTGTYTGPITPPFTGTLPTSGSSSGTSGSGSSGSSGSSSGSGGSTKSSGGSSSSGGGSTSSSGGSTSSGSGSKTGSSGSGSTTGGGTKTTGGGGTASGSGYDTVAPIELPSGATVIDVGSSESVKTVDAALKMTGKGKTVDIVVDPGTYSVSSTSIYGNVEITAADASNEPVLKIAGNDDPTLNVVNNLIINDIKTQGGSHGILLGSAVGANINAQNITMTDGGEIWLGSGGNNIYFRDNDVFGNTYKYVYGNFNDTVNSCTIDNSGDSNPIKQGGTVSGGNVDGEAAIRVMDVNDLTIIGVKTQPFFYKPGQEWKQDIQLRPSAELIRLIDCTFYNPDVGDMTWRSPAHPVDEVDFIDCTITEGVSLEAGAELVKFENTTIAGKVTNGSESFS
jgi:RTX calcium-binding nonapeptide repeat (4 copies)